MNLKNWYFLPMLDDEIFLKGRLVKSSGMPGKDKLQFPSRGYFWSGKAKRSRSTEGAPTGAIFFS